MEMLVYAAGAVGYSLLITLFALRVSGKRRGMRPRPNRHAGCDGADLIDPTVIFEYEEDGRTQTPLLLVPFVDTASGTIKEDEAEPPTIPQAGNSVSDQEEDDETIDNDLPPAERVIQHLLQDGFSSLVDLLQSSPVELVLAHLPRLFEFRNDERFIMVLADLLAHPAPEIQAAIRRWLDETDNGELLNELIALSINQTHAHALQEELEYCPPELAALSLPELLTRMNQERDEEKLLQLAGALARFPEEETLAALASIETPSRPPLEEPGTPTLLPPDPVDGPEDSVGARHLALARIGADIRPGRQDEYLRDWLQIVCRRSSFAELAAAAADANPVLRGRARIALARTRQTTRTWFLLRDGLLDPESSVRSASVKAIREFSQRALDRGLLTSSRDVRQLLLTHLLEESDPQVVAEVERTLFLLERNQENTRFQPLPLPELLTPKFRGASLEYRPAREFTRRKKAA